MKPRNSSHGTPDGSPPPSGNPDRSRATSAGHAGHRILSALVGPGASAGEAAVTFTGALAGTSLAVGAALASGFPVLATVVVGAVAFDFFGGAVATSTDAAKRRYHAPDRTLRHHLGFVAVHIQPFLLALFVPGLDWWTAAALYLLALAGAVVVGLAPIPLRRPVAFAATATGSAAALLFLPVPAALVWLAPVLLVKLLLGHMLPGTAQRTEGKAAHGTEEGRPDGAA